jgi:hypothetical protein
MRTTPAIKMVVRFAGFGVKRGFFALSAARPRFSDPV